jgi:hypothetical protein
VPRREPSRDAGDGGEIGGISRPSAGAAPAARGRPRPARGCFAWSPVLAAVTWGTAHRASIDSAYPWYGGRSPGPSPPTAPHGCTPCTRSTSSTACRSTTTGQLGIYYQRGNATGGTWGSARRLNATTEHGAFGAVAASGRYVYATWRTQVSYPLVAAEGRKIKFVRNTDHGASDAWKARKTIVDAGRVDRPTIAATGGKVYIAYTDAGTGQVRVRRSTDHGSSFSLLGTVIGTTEATGNDGGYAGFPVVAAAGDTVAVAWADTDGIWARYSTNSGKTFGSARHLDDTNTRWLTGTARGNRVAFA